MNQMKCNLGNIVIDTMTKSCWTACTQKGAPIVWQKQNKTKSARNGKILYNFLTNFQSTVGKLRTSALTLYYPI